MKEIRFKFEMFKLMIVACLEGLLLLIAGFLGDLKIVKDNTLNRMINHWLDAWLTEMKDILLEYRPENMSKFYDICRNMGYPMD